MSMSRFEIKRDHYDDLPTPRVHDLVLHILSWSRVSNR
jgi:hypothetical protein